MSGTKTIKCPQCGSIRKEEIGKEVYKCSNCGSLYFIDNDDITVNITQKISRNTTTANPFQNKRTLGVGIGIGIGITVAFIFLLIITVVLSSPNKNVSPNLPDNRSRVTATIREVMLIEDPYADNPSAFIIDSRRQGNNYRDVEYYAVLYDIVGQKIVKEQKIAESALAVSVTYKIKKQYDSWYLGERLQDVERVYKLDPVNLIIEDLGKILASKFTSLSAGVAGIEPDSYIDAFELITNDGLECLYSPYSDKLYEKERDIKADKDIPQYTTYFYGFTKINKSSSCTQGNQIQLLQLQAKSQNKKLKAYSLTWDYKCQLEAMWFNGSYNFVKDVTPDRKYFRKSNSIIDDDSPKVLFWNDKVVIAKMKASANPAAKFNLQSIDIETGSLNWTLETDWDEKVQILDLQEYNSFYLVAVKFDWQTYNFLKISKASPQLEPLGLPQYKQ